MLFLCGGCRVLFEDRFDDLPQLVVGSAPEDSGKRLLLGDRYLFFRGATKMIPDRKSSEIVS